ncbi:MAG TPA: bifunctional oligoribonuclease/PAP phosphatase NrnA [Clostridia bacterium]|nr:bifunctional oligoribonuclease/PAP phosphatase NrnA [Clostridia bacterium]
MKVRIMTDFTSVSKALLEGKNFVLTGHIMPDGDCLGSVLGLGIALQSIGKSVVMYSPDRAPGIYDFLPGGDQLVYDLNKEVEKNYDVLIALDCSVEDRLGNLKGLLERSDKKVINIDHHADNSRYGDYTYVDSTASATGEIIYNLLKFMDLEITEEVATCLYAAIMTDTDSFKYSNTSPETLRVAADLMELGASAHHISNWVYGEKPLGNLKALRAALDTLEVSPCGYVSWVVINYKTHRELGVCHEHTDGIVKTVRNIRQVEVGLLFRETEPGKIKISLRSKFRVNVSALAGHFGGGGHPRAAGCLIEGDLDKTVKNIVGAAVEAAGQRDPKDERGN